MLRHYFFVSREKRTLFFFIAGLLIGTLFFNFIGKKYLQDFVLYKGIIATRYENTKLVQSDLFAYLLWNRGKRVFILIALESFIPMLSMIYLYSTFYGFASGVFLSAFVMQYAYFGILIFGIWIFPHYIAYAFLWKIIISNKDKHLWKKKLGLVILLLLLGVALECWVNLFVIQFFLQKF